MKATYYRVLIPLYLEHLKPMTSGLAEHTSALSTRMQFYIIVQIIAAILDIWDPTVKCKAFHFDILQWWDPSQPWFCCCRTMQPLSSLSEVSQFQEWNQLKMIGHIFPCLPFRYHMVFPLPEVSIPTANFGSTSYQSSCKTEKSSLFLTFLACTCSKVCTDEVSSYKCWDSLERDTGCLISNWTISQSNLLSSLMPSWEAVTGLGMNSERP